VIRKLGEHDKYFKVVFDELDKAIQATGSAAPTNRIRHNGQRLGYVLMHTFGAVSD